MALTYLVVVSVLLMSCILRVLRNLKLKALSIHRFEQREENQRIQLIQ
jgi:hypothetical protein